MTAPVTTDSHRSLDVVAMVLLAVAALATAWSSYQANRWNGEQAKASGTTNALRIQAARSDNMSDDQKQVDIATYIQWVDAHTAGNADLETFYERRFREEFKPAFAAWIATDPFNNPAAPPTPFAMTQYRVAKADEAATLDEQSRQSSDTVHRNIQRSANYVLAVVLFAVVLFFAGISTKVEGIWPRRLLLAMGCVLFVFTVGWLATFPVRFSV